jgi:hypothetical protein
MKEILTSEADSITSALNNPFSKSKIVSIHIHIYTGHGGLVKDCRASIDFKNGNTSGEQKFIGEDFAEVAPQVQSFINKLNEQ